MKEAQDILGDSNYPAEKFDVLLAPTYSQANNWNRNQALLETRGAFAAVAQSFDEWIQKLWELNGCGFKQVNTVQARIIAETVIASHNFKSLKPNPGLAESIVVCAKRGCGVPSFDEKVQTAFERFSTEKNDSDALFRGLDSQKTGNSELTSQEWEMLACVGEYLSALKLKGLIEYGEILNYLVEKSAEVFPQPLTVGMLGDRPLSAPQFAFFERCPQLALFHKERLEITPLDKAPVPVTIAFPAGLYAQGQLVLDVLKDLRVKDSINTTVITSKQPLALYEKIALPLLDAGMSCAVKGRKSLASTDFGQTFLSVQRAFSKSFLWDKDALVDALQSSWARLSKSSAWALGKRLRGDRIIQQSCAFLELDKYSKGNKENNLSQRIETIQKIETDGGSFIEDFTAYCTSLRAQGFSEAYIREQQAACFSILDIFETAKNLGDVSSKVIEHLIFSATLSISVETSIQDKNKKPGVLPSVRIMDINQAAQLPEGSVDLVILCDLTTASYPLKEPSSAADRLLQNTGVEVCETSLAKARRSFLSLSKLPRKRLVLERCLNDEKGEPLYPSAMLEEFSQAYQEQGVDFPSTKLEEQFGFPEALLQDRFELGEECFLSDIRPIFGDIFSCEYVDKQSSDCDFLQDSDSNISNGATKGAQKLWQSEPQQLYPDLPRLSPSQIENFLDCPYKWFIANRLRTASLDEELGPRELGSFLHEVFQRFYAGFGEKITAENYSEAYQLMFGDDGAGSIFADVVKAQYEYDKQGHPHANRFVTIQGTSEEYEIAYLRSRVERWLQFETTFLPGFKPVAFECRLDGVQYGGCELRGVIDRIDVDSEGNAVVIDYKGSLKEEHRPAKQGSYLETAKVQTFMYASILKEAGSVAFGPSLEDKNDPFTWFVPIGLYEGVEQLKRIDIKDVVGAFYLSYNAGNTVMGAFEHAFIGAESIPTLHSAADSAFPLGEDATFEGLLQFTEKRVSQAVSDIVEGKVEANPQCAAACTFCSVLDCEKRWS